MRERAFTLLEVLTVVAILAVLGLAAVLSIGSATGGVALDAAAHEVAEALRFARSEAMRRGKPIGVRVLATSGTIEVFEPDTSSPTSTFAAAIRDPLSKRPYMVPLRTLPGCSRLLIGGLQPPFHYDGLAARRGLVVFDGRGEPHFKDAGTRRRLNSGQVVLNLDGQSRSVSLSPVGRVTTS